MLDIDLDVPPTRTPSTGAGPALDLVNGTVAPLDQVVSLLQNSAIEIPGWAGSGSATRARCRAPQAVAARRCGTSRADGVAGGDDDSTLKIGRSYAEVIGDMPHAVMGGSGWAADADLVGGTTHTATRAQRLPARAPTARPRSRPGLGDHPRP